MTIHPAVSMGFTPSGFLIYAPKPFRNNTFVLLLFVPDGTFRLVHHLIGTDNAVMAPTQETFEK